MQGFAKYGRFAALLGTSVATGIAGARTREGRLAAAAFPAADGGVHVLFDGTRTMDAGHAAFMNGVLMHVADYDDTHQASVVHPSGAVLPAVLAAAAPRELSIGAVVAAYACGLETLVKLAGMTPGEYHRHGFHATGVCGAVGAAVGVGVAAGLPRATVTSAASIAATHGGGTFEYIRTGGNSKVVYPGLAARWGLESVGMAAAGFEAPTESVEGAFGLVAAHTGGAAGALEVVMPSDLDTGRLLSADTAIKSFPCCYYSQVFLDATQRLMAEGAGSLTATSVLDVVCEGPSEMIGAIFEPRARRIRPTDPYDAKFALPFQIASMLVHGTVDLSTFSAERLEDPAVTALAARIVGVPTDELGRYPEQMPGRVTIRLADGSTRRSELQAAVGAQRWELGAEFIARRLQRDLGGSAKDLVEVLARPEAPATRLFEIVERVRRQEPASLSPVVAGRSP